MKIITKYELKEILERHGKWARAEEGGERADLRDADLRGADLRDANLRDADLRDADLCGANLCDADLCGAYLRGADLRGANLRDADLCGADLGGAYLRDADLRDADLCDADLRDADLRDADLCDAKNIPFIPYACPDFGSFIGYKKCKSQNGYYVIVELEILSDARRCSATGRKCRCDKAKVLSIQNIDGTPAEIKEARSKYDNEFIYRVGEIVEVNDFCEDRWEECSAGIHFFINRQEAVNY